MVVPEHFEKCSSMTFFVRQSGSIMPAATFALQVVTLLAAVTELLAAGDAAAGDCWSLPGLCADMFTSPAAAGLGGGGPGGPTAAARRTAGGTRFEACGTVAKSAEASYSPSECNFGARFAANLQMEGRKRTGLYGQVEQEQSMRPRKWG